MNFKKIGLTALLVAAPFFVKAQDTITNKPYIPKIKQKTEIVYEMGIRNIQYNLPLSKNISLFTQTPDLYQPFKQPALKPKILPFSAGIKIKL